MRRGHLLTCVGVVLLLAAALPLPAAEAPAEIAIGGGMVARIREKGSYSSVQARAAHIEKQLVEVVSTKDTQHPVISLKQNKAKLWAVYAWEIEVMAVYPAEAKANGLGDKQMGAIWAANLKRQLPLATPCSKLPPEMLGYGKPGAATATRPAAKPAAKPTAKPTTSGTTVAATVPVAPTPAATPTAKSPSEPVAIASGATESGALLLIVDTMRTARDMDEQAWVAGKEGLARSLFGDLSYYVTGKGTPPPVPVVTKPATTTKPATVAKPPTKPATTKPATTTTKPATTATKPPTTTSPVAKPATASAPAGKPATKPVPKPATVTKPTPAADPSMAKVPQKNRIRAKFAVLKPAYDKLAVSDPAAAQPVADLLAGSRAAFAKGDFDTSEQLADQALQALGVAAPR